MPSTKGRRGRPPPFPPCARGSPPPAFPRLCAGRTLCPQPAQGSGGAEGAGTVAGGPPPPFCSRSPSCRRDRSPTLPPPLPFYLSLFYLSPSSLPQARDRLTGEVITLKRLRAPGPPGAGGGVPAAAIREVSLLGRLKHPNIVQCVFFFSFSFFSAFFWTRDAARTRPPFLSTRPPAPPHPVLPPSSLPSLKAPRRPLGRRPRLPGHGVCGRRPGDRARGRAARTRRHAPRPAPRHGAPVRLAAALRRRPRPRPPRPPPRPQTLQPPGHGPPPVPHQGRRLGPGPLLRPALRLAGVHAGRGHPVVPGAGAAARGWGWGWGWGWGRRGWGRREWGRWWE